MRGQVNIVQFASPNAELMQLIELWHVVEIAVVGPKTTPEVTDIIWSPYGRTKFNGFPKKIHIPRSVR